MGRSTWDQYFMDIAKQVATRATCDRKHVGAVLVRDRTILSTGYNGSIRGLPHCDEVGHMMENGHCVATVHAEANAILQAAKNGVRHRRRHHLHDRQPLLAVLQADRELRLREDRLRRVLPGPADLRLRREARPRARRPRRRGRGSRDRSGHPREERRLSSRPGGSLGPAQTAFRSVLCLLGGRCARLPLDQGAGPYPPLNRPPGRPFSRERVGTPLTPLRIRGISDSWQKLPDVG